VIDIDATPSLRGALATKQSTLSFRGEMDCFASLAMTVEGAAPHKTVVPRESGVSSTPGLLGSIADVSGILDHPLSRVMTTEDDRRSLTRRASFQTTTEIPFKTL
jgi:hypothetical protein